MVKKQAEHVQAHLGELISTAMEQQGITMRDLARKLDITYEHVRRVVRGEGIPSKYVLKLFCEALGLNYKEAERLATQDKIMKKYGGIPLEISGKNPALQPIEGAWDALTEDQKRAAITMITSWAKQNKTLQHS